MAVSSLIGLDIGSTSVRVVDVARGKDESVLNHFGQAVLPAEAVQSGVVVDERAVAAALRDLWTSHKFRGKDVVLGISSQQVVVREIELPKLPPKELRAVLPFQVADILPIPVERAILDFYPLGETEAGLVRGLLIAAPKDAVLAAVHATERAGLRVRRVDLSALAVLRAAAHIGAGVEAIADIGSHATNLVVHHDGQPRVVRTIPRGGGEITEALVTRLHLTPSEAEAAKCRVGLDRAVDAEIAEIVADAVRPLSREIRNSLAYFATSHAPHTVERLALCGGGALLTGFAAALAAELGIDVGVANPLQRVRDSREGGRHDVLERFCAAATVSIGLTLGAA